MVNLTEIDYFKSYDDSTTSYYLILCTSNYLSEDDIRKNLGEAI